jgi:hypothetical protein
MRVRASMRDAVRGTVGGHRAIGTNQFACVTNQGVPGPASAILENSTATSAERTFDPSWVGFRSTPDCRPRRALLQLSYSYAPSYSDGTRDTLPLGRHSV